jgi:carboxymethylenebutenolidase
MSTEPSNPSAGMETSDGYLAVPGSAVAGASAPEPPWPGVVVIHDIFGMGPDIQRQADKLAAAGYLALAPDLWHGRPWPLCIRSAFRQFTSRSGPMFTELESAASRLAAMQNCTGKIGVIGFCMGGGFALLLAPRDGFAAASVNYGPVPKDAERVLAGSCPVVASYAGKDRSTTRQLPRLRDALAQHDVPSDIKVYPDAGHAFLNSHSGPRGALMKVAGMSYRDGDASDAWQRIEDFFGKHLNGSQA